MILIIIINYDILILCVENFLLVMFIQYLQYDLLKQISKSNIKVSLLKAFSLQMC